jgi:hypothetical protein
MTRIWKNLLSSKNFTSIINIATHVALEFSEGILQKKHPAHPNITVTLLNFSFFGIIVAFPGLDSPTTLVVGTKKVFFIWPSRTGFTILVPGSRNIKK